MELLSGVQGVQERLGPLKTWLFPPRIYLQIEDQSVTLMALEGRRITWLERVPLPVGLCEDGQPLRIDALSDLFGDLLVERGFNGARVDLVLPPAASQWRLVQWPDQRWPDDPERVLALNEGDLRLRAPLGYLDLHLVELAQDPPTTLVVSVPSKTLDGWIEVMAMAGASLDRVEGAKMCVCRGVQPLLSAPGAPALSVLLQLEPRRSGLLLLEAGYPVYERRLPGVEDMAAVQAELQRTLAFWRQLRSQTGPVQLLLYGSGLSDPSQADQLAACSGGGPCVVLDPLAQGWLEDASPDLGTPAPAGPALAMLWGLVSTEVLA